MNTRLIVPLLLLCGIAGRQPLPAQDEAYCFKPNVYKQARTATHSKVGHEELNDPSTPPRVYLYHKHRQDFTNTCNLMGSPVSGYAQWEYVWDRTNITPAVTFSEYDPSGSIPSGCLFPYNTGSPGDCWPYDTDFSGGKTSQLFVEYYDDAHCGVQMGNNRTLTIAYRDDLANEFTTTMLFAVTHGIMATQSWSPTPPSWSSGRACSTRLLTANELTLTLQEANSRLDFLTVAGVRYRVSWTERTYWTDAPDCLPYHNAPYTDNHKSVTVVGDGTAMQVDTYLPPPPANGYTIVLDEMVCALSDSAAGGDCGDDSGCGPCGPVGASGAASAGSGKLSVDGVKLRFSLGSSFDEAAGSLVIEDSVPAPEAAVLWRLRAHDLAPTVDVVPGANGEPFQYKAPQVLAHVEPITDGYALRFFANAVVGTKTGGIYPTNGAAYVSWHITSPGAATNNYNVLEVVEKRTGLSITNQYEYFPSTKIWTLLSGNGLKKELMKREFSAYSTHFIQQTNTYEIRDPANDALLYTSESVIQTMKTNSSVRTYQIQSVIGTGGSALGTTNEYYHANVYGYGGRLKQTQTTDGAWRYFEYDSNYQKVVKELSGHGDQGLTTDTNLCRTVYYEYSPVMTGDAGAKPFVARTITETLLGIETRRTYRKVTANQTVEYACILPGTYYYQAETAGYSLITTNNYVSSGEYIGRLQSVVHPDRTLTLYEYAKNGGGTQFTNTVWNGAPNGAYTAVTDGTRTITVMNNRGEVLSTTVYDIASGKAVDLTTYGSFSEQGHPGTVTSNDGRTVTYQYACCGLESVTDKDGLITTYQYDSLKRQVGSTASNIQHTNVLDAAGRTLMSLRIGSDSSIVTNSMAGYDDAGRVVATTNAFGGLTTYAESYSGGARTVTTTNPDGGTRIEEYFKDGRLKQVTGTAAQPVRYVYGFQSDGGSQREYTAEIKLNSGGGDSNQRLTNWVDGLGRGYKTVYAKASAPHPYREATYHAATGQLKSERDPDNVITLYQYNTRGEVEYTAGDTNRNSVIDFSGSDRISRSLRDVAADYGTTVHRTRSYIYTTVSSSTTALTGTHAASTNGLKSWMTVYRDGSTPVTTTNETVYGAGGARTNFSWQPNGARTESVYSYGRLSAVTQKDGTGAQTGKTTYAYDAHGRLYSTTDARNGATYFWYNSADRLYATTSPAPGNGQPALTTWTDYDNQGRVVAITHPDGRTVNNQYHLTGQLKKTWGSRTYPVEYTYDAQGRMETLKTWQDFNETTGTGTTGGATTTWVYDSHRGWLDRKVYQGETDTTSDYEYTDAGRLWKRHWERGVTTTYSYNNNGQLSGVGYSDSTAGVSYSHDRRGRLATALKNGMTSTYAYNEANQPTQESWSGGTLGGWNVNFAYDTRLLRTNILVKQSTTTRVDQRYAHDTALRLQHAWQDNYTNSYTYVANSPLIDRIESRQGGTLRLTGRRQHDHLNRLTRMGNEATGTGAGTVSFDYRYNDAGQRVRTGLADGSYWVYEYDAMGQVISGRRYWADHTPVAGQQYEYAFDDIGNRTGTKAGGDQNGGGLRSAGYTRNLLNQYTQRAVPGALDVLGAATATSAVTVNSQSPYRKGEYFWKELSVANGSAPVAQSVTVSVSGTGSQSGSVLVPPATQTFAYDADGNLTNDLVWVYTWDAENRLVQMTNTLGVTSSARKKLLFEYDHLGRRIRQRVFNWASTDYSGTATNDFKYLYDGWNVVLELTNSVPRNSYLWGTDLSGSQQGAGGVGGLLMVTRHDADGDAEADEWYFAGYDGNGNVAGLVNGADGTWAAKYEYGPFGEAIRLTGGAVARANPYRFSTKPEDNATGLLYYGYRYLNPSTGRWINRDPVYEIGGPNLFGFYGNDLINRMDLFGLQVEAPTLPIPETVPGTNPRPQPGSPQPTTIPGGLILGTIYINMLLNDLNDDLDAILERLERTSGDTQPVFGDSSIDDIVRGGRRLGGSICRQIARMKPLSNNIIYSSADSKNRSRGAFGVIWGHEQGKQAVAEPPGWLAVNGVNPGTADRAHLIAKRFGGDGQLHNLATVDKTFNRAGGQMYRFESRIDQLLATRECFVCAFVIPVYLSGKPTPAAFVFGIFGENDEVYEFNQFIAPALHGDLRLDNSPWNRWSNGGVENLNYR